MVKPALLRIANAAVRRTLASRKEFSALISIDEEYPGLPILSPQTAKATVASVTTLPSGLTVVTEDASTRSTVTMTFPKAGSANEKIHEHGVALINKCLNFKSGSGLSTILINRTIEDEGGIPVTSVDRYKATVGFTVVPERALELIPLLITDCSFEKWDVRDAKNLASTHAEVASESAQLVLTENLFAAAYGPQSPAGRPLYTSEVPALDDIKSFRSRAYGLNGAVLTVTGVKDHSSFCTQVGSLLSDAPRGSSEGASPVAYLGGESRVAVPSMDYAYVALGFAGPVSSVMTSVVKHLFTLIGHPSGVTAFAAKGLVGLYAGSASPSTLVDAIIKTALSTVTPDLVKRAKALAKTEAAFALDGGSQSLADALTAAVLDGKGFSKSSDLAATYDSVSDAQIKDTIAGMLKSKPAMAALGDIALVPYHATVASRLS